MDMCYVIFLLPDNERSISQIEATLNPFIQGVINLKNYEHLTDKRKYFDAYHICCRCNCAANLLLFLKWMVKPHFIFFALFLLLWLLLSFLGMLLIVFYLSIFIYTILLKKIDGNIELKENS